MYKHRCNDVSNLEIGTGGRSKQFVRQELTLAGTCAISVKSISDIISCIRAGHWEASQVKKAELAEAGAQKAATTRIPKLLRHLGVLSTDTCKTT